MSAGTCKKKQTDSFELKMGSCPVNGRNTYSVFKNGVLVFMMDGDRASVFRTEDVEVISEAGNDNVKVYRVGAWAFTGSLVMTQNVMRLLPKGCAVCPAEGKMVE